MIADIHFAVPGKPCRDGKIFLEGTAIHDTSQGGIETCAACTLKQIDPPVSGMDDTDVGVVIDIQSLLDRKALQVSVTFGHGQSPFHR